MTKEFIVEAPHTKEECLNALDEMAQKDPDFLSKSECACMEGNHTCWTSLSAKDKAEIRDRIPSVARSKAKIYEVNRYTPEQIKSFHEM
jgi:hypothetical protein